MSLPADLPAEVGAAIGAATGKPFAPAACRAVAGGCINRSLHLTGQDGRDYFVKLNRAERLELFAAEADGLAALAATETLRVPAPITWGASAETAWLVLEYLELTPAGDASALGRGLAALHRAPAGVGGNGFGWHCDNTLGATPQPNARSPDWVTFFRDRRLGHQLRLARQNQAPARLLQLGERLLADLAGFFPGRAPSPSLLHGDLWGGNHAYCERQPVVFDPAVYLGDREADLAMTELFGGFSREFHAAYRDAWPLDAGYATRRNLYNLYHVLNHFNLFGGGYARQAEHMALGLIAELG